MATSNGSSSDDIITGTSGADTLNGGAGSDALYGGAGNDSLNGGSGNDILDGGSGSDTLNGDSGNDVLVYRLAENVGSGDLYTGGSGIDSVRLMLTNAEWLQDSIQLELARYYAHLALVQRNTQGEVSNGSSRDFTFNFGTSTLTVQMMERLEVYVDGARIANLDAPVIDVLDSMLTGTVTEDGNDDASASTVEAISGSVKFFDLDNFDTHSVSVVAPAGALGTLHATLINAATGDGQGSVGWTYTLNDSAAQSLAAGASRTEVFLLTVTDDEGQSVTQSVTITIRGTNDGPVAVADTNSATEGGAVLIGSVAGNDSDADDGAILSYALDAPAPAGLTFNADGSYSFDPSHAIYQHLAAGATQNVVVGYTVTDEHGASSSSTLSITVTGTNDGPVAVADVAGATEDGAVLTGSVAGNDSDADDGATLSYALNAPAPGGLTFGADGSYTFDPSHAAYQHLAAGATQNVVVGYAVTDEHGASSSSTLSITVTGTNDGPVAIADTNSATEDGATISGSVAGNDHDADDGATLSYALNASAPAGLTFGADGSYTFDPSHAAYQHLAAGATQNVTIGYAVTDEHGASSSSTLSITVTGTNDGPVAFADEGSATEGGAALIGSVAANDSDADDGATLAYALDAPAPAGLTFSADGSYSFDPSHAAYEYLAAGATQNVVVGYTVTDEHGASSSSALTITVTGTNDAPVNTVPAGIVTTNEEGAKAITGLSIADVDANASNMTVALSATHGVLAVSGGAGVTVGGSGTANVTLTGTVAAINAALAAANAVTYTPVANFNGNDQLTMVTTDSGLLSDTDSVAIAVNAVNDAPTATNDVVYVSNNTNAITIPVSALLGNDLDSDGLALTVSSVGSASGGVSNLLLNSNGTITFNSNNSSSGSFTYTISDNGTPAGTSTGTVTVNIISTNGSATVDLSTVSYQGSYLDGGSNNDSLTGGGVAPDILLGGAANDTLVGGAGNDVLRGGAGNDTIDGGAGIDMLDFSDAGAAITITLNQGTNSGNPPSLTWSTGALAGVGTDGYKNVEGVIGSAFNDTITGSSGNDVLNGGGGNDTINGGAGIDLLDFSTIGSGFTLALAAGGTGTATVDGTDNYSNMEGLIGGNGNDTLTGNSADNVLQGRGGNDALNGAAGSDVLIGGAGADSLTGGAGSDTIRFLGGDAASVDTVTDFDTAGPGSGGDVLDISDLLIGAPSVTAGNIADYLSIQESGGNSILSIDRDGTGVAHGFQDFVVLTGLTGLSLASLFANNSVDVTT